MPAQVLGIDFRHNQWHIGIHAESAAIVDNDVTKTRYAPGIAAAELPSCRQKTDLRLTHSIK